VVSPDDKVVRPIVPPNDGVPEGFTGAGHTHRQWQQAKDCPSLIAISLHQGLVSPNASVGINIPRPCKTHHGMDQYGPIYSIRSTLYQLLMGSVNGISCLKGNDIRISH
jgi:hypothetical protein